MGSSRRWMARTTPPKRSRKLLSLSVLPASREPGAMTASQSGRSSRAPSSVGVVRRRPGRVRCGRRRAEEEAGAGEELVVRAGVADEDELVVRQQRRLGLALEDDLAAPDVREVGVAERAEPGLLDGLPGEGGVRRHAHLELVVAASPAEPAGALPRQQTMPDEGVVERDEKDGRDAHPRQVEEAEPRQPLGDQQTVDDDVRARPDQREPATDDGGRRERHEQLGCRQPRPPRPRLHARDQHRHDGRVVEDAREHRRREHQAEERRAGAVRARPEQPVEPAEGARPLHARRHDEQGADGDDGRVGEPRKRLLGREDAGEHEQPQRPHQNEVRPGDAPHERAHHEDERAEGDVGLPAEIHSSVSREAYRAGAGSGAARNTRYALRYNHRRQSSTGSPAVKTEGLRRSSLL